MKRKLILCSLFSFIVIFSFAQEKLKIKFGDINPEDFKPVVYQVDSNASAVVIADIGSTEIIGNNQGSFSLLFKRYCRAHILNKNGYDIATVEIPLYTNGQSEENIENLRAVSYNLENGKVVETKLDLKSGVFKDKISKYKMIRKFTLPNIKEGSIIEFEYRIKSDFVFNLQPWEFQGEYPILWSEYNVAFPSFYNYVTLTQGYQPYYIKDVTTRTSSFNWADSRGAGATERERFDAKVSDNRWVMKDVPALKEESYTSTINNHIARIEFQLASMGEPFTFRRIMSTWDIVAKELMDDDDFGAQLKKDNGWLNEAIGLATGNASSETDKARKIYAWVRDNFTCTNYNGKYLEQPLKNVLKSKTGNVAEINLLLTAMLRKAGLQAYPVILSTRSHGYANPMYPLMDRFNYLVSKTVADGKDYLLDASEAGQGFGRLGYECYNGHARIIDEQATPIDLDPSSVKESKNTIVIISNDEKGNYTGSLQQTPGYFESYRLRNTFKEKGKQQISADIKKTLGDDVELSNVGIDSIGKYDEPVGIHYDLDFKNSKDAIIYFNPLLGEGFRENPFKSVQRLYPVEMPFTVDETYILQMELPSGYVVDEMPKALVIKLNEQGDASYEYRISTSGNSISFRSRLLINKAFFQPEEYEVLREFFSMIVKKQNEQIVFKKKTNP